MREPRIVTVIGGTGFVGRCVVRHLGAQGYRIRVVARRPELAKELKTAGDVGQISLTSGNINQPESYAASLQGAFAVVNLVGILYESGNQTFPKIHAQGSEKLAQAAKAAGVSRFIQISALGVDKATGRYAHTKAIAEKAVLAAFPEVTILRPSIIFGPDDHFFNHFAAMASLSPALPLIGGGKTRFQPVYVGDVAKAIELCLQRADTAGQTYELGGPHVYSFKEILQYILTTIGRSRSLMNIPFPIATMIGTMGELLPKPPLTRDQVTMLKHDNVVTVGAQTFAHLNLHPTALDIVVPDYLARFNKKAKAA
ncbi:MAG: complex I NDUFA9 subunit family protein [Rickettsiales bacterium]|nr:complex I NDUFA9 subunit family protein [Rickettsiales bacterium]